MLDRKPAINRNFNDPSVKKLADFITHLQQHHKREPNLSITIRVLECLMFIKLNFSWIRYAIKNKTTDASIYQNAADKAHQVLRADNGMSFHIVAYDDP